MDSTWSGTSERFVWCLINTVDVLVVLRIIREPKTVSALLELTFKWDRQPIRQLPYRVVHKVRYSGGYGSSQEGNHTFCRSWKVYWKEKHLHWGLKDEYKSVSLAVWIIGRYVHRGGAWWLVDVEMQRTVPSLSDSSKPVWVRVVCHRFRLLYKPFALPEFRHGLAWNLVWLKQNSRSLYTEWC